ncbi:hypothetical protein E2C01_010348 [Portunus trituberculatus]|uniref:Uncharacterized protein n=1 Tax=Portunus trituberculatus TaxID=210409 RepID=A0A5B7D868_PORTR|nr:hypothetical protein [Portunus trituberculatus]
MAAALRPGTPSYRHEGTPAIALIATDLWCQCRDTALPHITLHRPTPLRHAPFQDSGRQQFVIPVVGRLHQARLTPLWEPPHTRLAPSLTIGTIGRNKQQQICCPSLVSPCSTVSSSTRPVIGAPRPATAA